jgi:hypothetical protein
MVVDYFVVILPKKSGLLSGGLLKKYYLQRYY